MIIKGILFIVLFSAAALLFGSALSRAVRRERSLLSSYVWGLIVLLAAVQLVAYPLYRLNCSFTLFVVLYTIVLVMLMFFAILTVRRSGLIAESGERVKASFSEMKKVPLLTLILAGAIVFLALYMFGFYYPTSDDGYYMTRSMEVIEQNSMGVNVRTAWLGWSEGEVPDYTDASTFVFFVSYISFLTGISATVMSKVFLAVCLFAAHLAAIWIGFDAVLGKRSSYQKKSVSMILYILFQILSVKQSSAGIWMTGYIWNGKSMLPGFVFPLLTAECFFLMRKADELDGRSWVPMTLLMLSGISFSIVGLNLPIILYFTYGAAFLILTGFRSFRKIWKGALCSVIPVAVFAVLSYLFVITGQNDYYESGTTAAISWFEQFLEACDFFQFVLWGLSAAYILFRGERLQKILLVGAPILLFCTFLNPLLTGPVCKYVTTSLVYWRLWWLLPLYLLPAAAISDVIDRLCGGNLQGGFLCAALSVVMLSGFEIFRYCITDSNYTVIPYVENVGRLINARPELRPNIYGINGAPYEIAKAVENDWNGEDKPRLLMYFNRNYEIRQYTTDIVMAVGIRDVQLTEKMIPGTELTETDFMKSYSQITDGDVISKALSFYDVDYVCFDGSTALEYPEGWGLRPVADVAGISLWRFTK